MSEIEKFHLPRSCFVEERDLLTWWSLAPALALGVFVEVAWFILPWGLFRDLLILSPGILPLVLYKRLRGWRTGIALGFLAGLTIGMTRLTWLGNWGELFGTEPVSPGMAQVVPNYAAQRSFKAAAETFIPAVVVGLTGLVMWAVGRLIFGRLIIGDGTPQCRRCGYNLTGNVSDRCPECGSTSAPSHTAAAPTCF